MHDQLLALNEVSKRFGATLAVSRVSLELRSGKTHALVGENGAGKSTIVRMIAGAVNPDAGEIFVDGKPVEFHTPADALRAGIATIYQDRALIPEMSVGDNIALGRERGRLGLISPAASKAVAKKYLAEVGLNLNPERIVRELSVHEQQLVAVAKALSVDARIFVFDEPTAALTLEETERLFEVIAGLTTRGCAVVYVTHRLRELEEIADDATVLKDGEKVAEVAKADVREEILVPLMVGREIDRLFPELDSPKSGAEVILEAEEVWIDATIDVAREGVSGASLRVLRGEIVGLAGLEGSGRSSFARALAGIIAPKRGDIRVLGHAVRGQRVTRNRKPAVAYIPPDRRTSGVIPEFSVQSALTLSALRQMRRFGLLDLTRERRAARRAVDTLSIRPARLDAPTRTLSGGNQQKTVLGRALTAEAELLVCEEPTAGVDIGARADIYSAIVDLAKKGKGVVISSSDALELMGLCHRIVVFCEGRVVRDFPRNEVTEEELVRTQFQGGPNTQSQADHASSQTHAARMNKGGEE